MGVPPPPGMSFKTMSRNNLRKLPKRHSERPGDLTKNLETPGKTGSVGGKVHGPGWNSKVTYMYVLRLLIFFVACENSRPSSLPARVAFCVKDVCDSPPKIPY